MKYVTTQVAAHLLGTTAAVVRARAEKGFIKCRRTPSGHREYELNSINEYLAQWTTTEVHIQARISA